MIAAIRWHDGALELLDQTRLPAEEAWLRCSDPEEVADAIRRLAVRGAPLIGLAAAYGMALGARLGRPLEESAELLGSTRPTAVNLAWAISLARETDGSYQALLELARSLHSEQLEADRRMADLGATLFARGERVLTHCNTGALATGGSGTALGVICAAFASGGVELVWVGETRPLLQGARLTAWELEKADIPYRVLADASAGALMAGGLVDRVIVGADRIAANGDVANKIGTYPLAVLADRHRIPFVVAAPLSTVDLNTPSGADIPIEERDPLEVTTFGEATNLAFDVTPHELVSAIVSEAGVLEPPYAEALAQACAAEPQRA